MTALSRRRLVRAIAGLRAAGGTALIARPESVARHVNSGRPLARGVLYLLGARLIIQSVIEFVHPTRPILRVGAAVDVVHALSMGPVVTARPDVRRAAATSAAVAVVFAGAMTAAAARKPQV